MINSVFQIVTTTHVDKNSAASSDMMRFGAQGAAPASLPFLAMTQGRAAQSGALDVSQWKADKRAARG